MSGVYSRLRKITSVQFLATAMEIHKELALFCTKDTVMPKKYRLLLGVPLVNKATELMDNIFYADTINAINDFQFNEKLKYQQLALSNCYQLQTMLISAENIIETVTVANMDKLIDLIGLEFNLLNKWKDSTKIVKGGLNG